MTAGKENINKVKFCLENLPEWMRFLQPNANTRTYLDLNNSSTVSVCYPSTIKSPDQLARSLTIPFLYVDEAAFIRNIDRIWMSAQPTLSTARKQAEKYGYPSFSILTSTPNGTAGTGQFFYDLIQNSVDSDQIFEVDTKYTKEDETNNNFIYEKFTEDADSIMSAGNNNGFIFIKYHWSEDPTKDNAWYLEQCKEQNFNRRKIAQEYDIQFVGSTDNPFEDSVLEALQKSVTEPISYHNLPHSTKLKWFKEINPSDYYLIGVDTASSIDNCYSAIEVYSFKNFEQVGELVIRLGSLSQYSDIVIDLGNYLLQRTSGRIILCIENNSIKYRIK